MVYLDSSSSDSQCYKYTQKIYHLPWHQKSELLPLPVHTSKTSGLHDQVSVQSTMKYLGSCDSQCNIYTQNRHHLPWHHNLNYYHYLYINLKHHGSMVKCPYISTMKYLGYCDSQCYRYIIYLGITILIITITCT